MTPREAVEFYCELFDIEWTVEEKKTVATHSFGGTSEISPENASLMKEMVHLLNCPLEDLPPHISDEKLILRRIAEERLREGK